MKNKEYLQTTDTGFIAYLLCKGYKFALPPFTRIGYVHYTFERSPEIDREHDMYYSGQASIVDVYGYQQTLINLRHQINKLLRDTPKEVEVEEVD